MGYTYDRKNVPYAPEVGDRERVSVGDLVQISHMWHHNGPSHVSVVVGIVVDMVADNPYDPGVISILVDSDIVYYDLNQSNVGVEVLSKTGATISCNEAWDKVV